jgi:glutaredoxin
LTKDSSLILYTHPDCSYSTAAKSDFDDQGIRYTEKDITQDPKFAQELEELTKGERITPVIVEDGRVIIGYMGVG